MLCDRHAKYLSLELCMYVYTHTRIYMHICKYIVMCTQREFRVDILHNVGKEYCLLEM